MTSPPPSPSMVSLPDPPEIVFATVEPRIVNVVAMPLALTLVMFVSVTPPDVA